MITTVIFDFDGLILDTETAWYHSYRDVLLKEYHFELPLDVFAECVGSEDTSLFRYLQTHLRDALDISTLKEQASALHTEKMKQEPVRNGVRELLAEARNLELNIALASSSNRTWVTNHLQHVGLLECFDTIVTSEDVETVKPAPDLFLKVLDKLDVAAEKCFVFEDSLNGLQAAHQVNLNTIVIPNPVTQHLPFKNYYMKVQSMEHVHLRKLIG